MTLRDQIHQRFLQLGKSYLRASDEDAATLADVVSESHSVLGAFCVFCQAPTLRTPEINAAILTRWMNLVPRWLDLPRILSRKSIEPAVIPSIGEPALHRIYEAANTVAQDIYGMSSIEASEFANCIRNSASSCFAFYQRCMSPKDHTLAVLAGHLAAYVGAVTYAAAANLLVQVHDKAG